MLDERRKGHHPSPSQVIWSSPFGQQFRASQMPQFDFSSLAESFKDPKLVRFAIIGAVGCLIGAALGELLLAATRPAVGPAQAVCLLIDCSGSMLYGGGAG